MTDMASRLSALRSLLPDLETALKSFTTSPSKFRIIRTINPTPTDDPHTLYILDSSFNPPTLAHYHLARTALSHSPQSPNRLLFLFSTHNADKAPSPAAFPQRLALMTALAEDLSRTHSSTSIDIGLTKEPYYTEKSSAIAAANEYLSQPTHVHLIGYDTLTRFCNPKYYAQHAPPLSALKPFFDAGHRLLVTQRPSDGADEASGEFGTSEEQEGYVKGLGEGELKDEGFERGWAEQIEVLGAGEGAGVSSTRVRNAAKEGRWEEVGELCTQGVAEWVRDQGLYTEDANEKKTMG